MNKIALFGRPYSGKSTLALELKARGYVYVNFSRHLKVLAATAIGTVRPTTVEDIEENKELWRPFLREFNKVIGYESDPSFIENALFINRAMLAEKVVFDNPRTVQQAQTLKKLGFSLVGLTINPTTALDRSHMTMNEYLELIQNPLEDQQELFKMADEIVSSDFYPQGELAARLEKWEV